MAIKPLEHKLTAILYADVAGYSRLTGEDEEGTHRRLSASLDAITASIKEHNGTVMHFAGDAVLADFATVSDAVICAVTLQRELGDRSRDLPEDRKIYFRMGVNLGEVIVDRGEIYGDGVNIAARLESLAEPGGICISDFVRGALGNKLPLDYEFMGEQRVKNIAEPVKAYRARLIPDAVLPTPGALPKIRRRRQRLIMVSAAVAVLAIGASVIAWLTQSPSTSEPVLQDSAALPFPANLSIAVLPFNNMSDDSEQEYFADGMTEDLITDLSKVSGLFVIARTSSFTYKGRVLDVREVARELGVRYVLEGSVRKAGNRIRINAQLIDATTGGHVWAERYDRQLIDIFDLQNEVTEHIVTALAVRLTPQESERVTHRSTNNVTAYDHFLRGLALARTSNYEEAREEYQQAIDSDPGFARAYGALSVTYTFGVQYGRSTDPQSDKERALALAKKAIAIDDNVPQVHFALGFAYFNNRDHGQAVNAVRRAIELDPGYTDAFGLLAWIHSHAGDPQEALRVLEKAKRLNPYPNAGTLGVSGLAHFLAGDLDEAIEVHQASLDSNPELTASRIYLSWFFRRALDQNSTIQGPC
jgi:adenylate cyclase